MRLDYNILWVEDTTDWVDTYRDEIEEHLHSLGFKLNVDSQTQAPVAPEDIQRLTRDQYHLILMDYELGQGKNGADVIRQIRGFGIITEVVFYSADSNNLTQAKGTPLEGVYWATRDDFSQRVNQIIRLTIRRVMDLPAMRGLAVAEIADLDQMMNSLIAIYHDKQNTEDAKNAFRTKIVDRLTRSVQDRATQFDGKKNQFLANLELLLNDTTGFLDSTKRWRVVSSDVANSVCQADEECLSILKEYESILKQRNDLAHGYSHRDSDGIEKIKGREKEYSMEDALQIRLGLLKHKDNLQALLSKFTEKE